jgi:diguanylate cyclase
MQYTDSIDESRQYLRLALEQIGKHGLPTDPLNYSVWYEYASEKNKELVDAIDNFVNGAGAYPEDLSQKIYREFIADKKELLNDLVRDGLKKVLGEIVASIAATNQQYDDSENQLININGSLLPGLSEAEVEMIAKRVQQQIEFLESTNSSFKNQLDQATKEIDELKDKLEQYRTESIKDPLTQIDNRRGFDKKLNDAIDNANENQTSLCLIMADIDHFKKINDTYGHLVGDNVIRMVAGTLKNSVKGRDDVARIGGEEFTVILPDTPIDGALKLAEDMRVTFDKFDLKKKNSGESLGKVTLSFGVTKYQFGESAEAFINRSDEALYKSKNTGRNKVSSK